MTDDEKFQQFQGDEIVKMACRYFEEEGIVDRPEDWACMRGLMEAYRAEYDRCFRPAYCVPMETGTSHD